jgi:DNA polymerase-3 subunit gamma/tau
VSAGPSLYRRHRPRTFDEVVGQEHVVRTLRNAVEQGKVHHAYLFVGSRGTGKTSMAKILAACLNCERGPTIEPCGCCDSCRAIAGATSLDVIEMDAASNNSVDDIRELRERVAYAPVSGRSKVYILDEAHMLSTQAWNAFLKTLEEPPPDTIFVLATTEAQKVLPTVVDRCHRFDFGRPGVEQIAAVLRRAAAAEAIELPDAAVGLIARHATGSFRDALGTLEQLVTYSGSEIALEDVLAVLGVADAELLFAAVDAVADGDPAEALRAADRLSESGRDSARFFGDLEAHARDVLVVGTLGEVPPELRATPERDERLLAQAARLEPAAAARLLELLAGGMGAIKNGADPRTQLELALVKAATAGSGSREAPAREPAPAPAGEPPAPAPPAAQRESRPLPVISTESDSPAGPVAALDMWPAVLETVRAENTMLAAALDQGRAAVAGDEILVAFPSSADFFKRLAEKSDCRAVLARAVKEVAGEAVPVTYELRADLEPVAARPLSPEELIERFKQEFDAEEILEDRQEPVR